MQTFYGTFVVGLGLFLGGMIGGWFGGLFETGPGETTLRDQLGIVSRSGLLPFYRKVEGVETQFFADWPGIWLAGAAISAVALAAFLLFFPNDKHDEKTTQPTG